MTETETVLKAQKSKQLEVTPKLTIIEWSRVLNEVQGIVCYKFNHKKLLDMAFTHTSFLDKSFEPTSCKGAILFMPEFIS